MEQTAAIKRVLDKKLSSKLFKQFTEFAKSNKYEELSKRRDKVGSRLRSMKSDHDHGRLTDKRILLFFADLELIKKIKLKEF